MKRIKAWIQFCAEWVFGPTRAQLAELRRLQSEVARLTTAESIWLQQDTQLRVWLKNSEESSDRWRTQCEEMLGIALERDQLKANLEASAEKLADTRGLLGEVVKELTEAKAIIERFKVSSERLRKKLVESIVPFEPRETDSAPAFDQEDSAHLREFLATNTGQRLARLVNWWSQYEEQKATLASARHEYFCGRGAGFRACGAFVLQRLSADTRPQQGEDTQASNGAAGLRERHAP